MNNIESGSKALIKAGVRYVPYIGGPLSSLLGDRWSAKMQARLERFVRQLDERIRMIEAQQDDGYQTILIRALRTVANDHREFKRSLFLNILQDAAKKSGADLSLHQVFARLVEDLEPHHVSILRRLGTTQVGDYSEARTRRHVVTFTALRDALRLEADADGVLRDDLTHEGVSTLTRQGLIMSHGTQTGLVFGGESSPDTFLRASVFWLTPLGRRFAAFAETGK